MMNTIMTKIQRFGRISRQLHTIIFQETIKPSSPTPPHLKTHNLSLIDYFSPNIHIPFIFFYKNSNTNNGDINILKKSLSQCLTQYYPFAGRLLTPSAPYINCNDQGVEFFEASIDSRLDDFILKKEQDETFDQLIPNALGCAVNKTSPNMVEVQLNHFTCGGAALAVSISHKVADGFTMVKFINDWASVIGGGSPIISSFFSSSSSNIKIPEFALVESTQVKYATRRFVFPNSKINHLKTKINAMGASNTTPLNPTRVESLTSLLFKCASTASTIKSGSIKVSNLNQMANLRGKTNANFPKLAIGNLYSPVITKAVDSSGIKLNEVITGLRKEMVEIQGVTSVEEVGEKMVNAWVTLLDDQSRSYTITSMCRFPFYEVDFGWGKPVRVMLRSGSVDGNFLVLMDTPCGDGIEATVQLEEEEMAIFQEDKELLAYAQDI